MDFSFIYLFDFLMSEKEEEENQLISLHYIYAMHPLLNGLEKMQKNIVWSF